MQSQIQLFFNTAKQLFASKLYSKAFELYEKIYNCQSATHSEKVRALNNISLCCACEKNFNDAQKWAVKSLSLDEKNVRALIRAAIACEGQNKYQKGLQYLTRANQLQADNSQVQKLSRKLKNILHIDNDINNRTTGYTKQITNDVNDDKCSTYNDNNVNDNCSKCSANSSQQYKKLQFYYSKNIDKAKTAMLRANYNDAIRYYTKAIDLHLQLYKQGLQQNNVDKQHKNDQAVLLCNRSAAYFHQGKYSASLDDATSASQLNQLYSRAYYRQACALNKLHHYKDAFGAINKCLTINPQYPQALSLRAQIEPHVLQQQKSASEKLQSHLRQVNEIKQRQQLEVVQQSTKALPALRPSAHAAAYTYCNYCNERGHTRNECPLRRRKRSRCQ